MMMLLELEMDFKSPLEILLNLPALSLVFHFQQLDMFTRKTENVPLLDVFSATSPGGRLFSATALCTE